MIAAIAFQIANMLVSVALVPLLLGMLGAREYLTWVVFITIGGLSLQIEFAIQTLMARRVAPLYRGGDAARLAEEDVACKRAFARLAASMLVLALPAGYLYLAVTDRTGAPFADADWVLAWPIFCIGYALNYFMGFNNVRLIASGRTNHFYWIAALGRVTGFALTAFSLLAGQGLVGLSVAFLLSVLLTVLAMAVAVHKTVAQEADRHARPAMSPPGAGSVSKTPADSAGLLRFLLFSITAFLLYRGAFLAVVGIFPTSETAAYALALQIFAIFSAVAAIPTNVRLHRMAEAIRTANSDIEDDETLRWLAFAPAVFLAGVAGLLIVGPPALQLIRSAVRLPDAGLVLLLAGAFLIETWILILVNPLLIRRDLGFVRPCVGFGLLALGSCAVALALGAPLWLAMISVPMALQMLLTLPSVLRALAVARGVPTTLMRRQFGSAMRRAMAEAGWR